MLDWTVMSCVVALFAGSMGFGVVDSSAGGMARILFFVFIVLLVVGLIRSFSRRS